MSKLIKTIKKSIGKLFSRLYCPHCGEVLIRLKKKSYSICFNCRKKIK